MPALKKKRAGWKRWTLSIFATLVVLYLLGGFLLIPLALQFGAPRVAGGIIEGRLELGAVRMNPLTFSATIREAVLHDPDGAPALSFERLHANLDPVKSLFKREFTASEVSLAGLRVNVVIEEDGELNLVRATALRDPSPPPEEPSGPFDLPAAVLGKFALDDARIHFEDRSRPVPFAHTITSLTLLLEDVRTGIDHNNTYEFAATGETGERLVVEGGFQLDPLSFAGRVTVDGFGAPDFAPLYADLLPVELADGRFQGSFAYHFAPLSETPRLGIADGSFVLEAVDLRPLNDEPAFFRLERLAVTGIAADLFGQRASIESVEVGPGFLKAAREADGSIDLLALIPEPGDPPARTESAEPGERSPIAFGILSGGEDLGKPVEAALARIEALPDTDWVFELSTFDFSGFAVEVEDRTGSEPVSLAVNDIALRINKLTNTPEQPAELSLSFLLNDAGTVAVNGTIVPDPAAADLQFEVTGLDLRPFAPLGEPFVPLHLDSGVLDVSGDTRAGIGPEGEPFADVRASAGVRDFSIRISGDEHALAAFRQFTVTDLHAVTEPLGVEIAEIRLEGPRARVERLEDGTLAVLRLVPEGTPPDAAPASEPGPAPVETPEPGATEGSPPVTLPLRMHLGRFVLEDGDVEFLDASVQPPGRIELKPFRLLAESISLEEGTETTAEFTGTLAEAGTIEWHGSTRLADVTSRTRLELAIREIPLAAFSPYAIDGVGRPIDSGAFSADVDVVIDENVLNATNQLRVQTLRFGRTESGRSGPPVGIAVAALEDRNGLITLDVPLRGSLDNPDFQPAQLFVRILRTTATRALTAPLSIAGSLVGGTLSGISVLQSAEADEDPLDRIGFAGASSRLDAGAEEVLTTLTAFLADRPQARLKVIPSVSPRADLEAMVRAELESRLAATGASPHSRAVRQLYADTFGVPGPSDAEDAEAPARRAQRSPGFYLSAEPRPDLSVSRFYRPEGGETRSAGFGFFLDEPVRRERPEPPPTDPDDAEPDRAEPELAIAEMERRLVEAIDLGDAPLDDLAGARFETVRGFITASGEVEEGRVVASPREEGEPGVRFAFDTDLD